MVLSAITTATSNQPLTQQLFSQRESIPSRTNVLWKIERGVVRTQTWSEEGKFIVLGYWGAGDVVGHSLSRVLPYQIQCLTSVETSILPSELWHQELEAIVLHTQQAEELHSILHRNPISLRLWQFLLWLEQKFGCDIDQGRLIDLGITQEEIAAVINTTRVTVTRLLQQFESEGILRRHQRRLVLCWH